MVWGCHVKKLSQKRTKTKGKTSIHSLRYPARGHRWDGGNPSCHRARGRVHPGQATNLLEG